MSSRETGEQFFRGLVELHQDRVGAVALEKAERQRRSELLVRARGLLTADTLTIKRVHQALTGVEGIQEEYPRMGVRERVLSYESDTGKYELVVANTLGNGPYMVTDYAASVYVRTPEDAQEDERFTPGRLLFSIHDGSLRGAVEDSMIAEGVLAMFDPSHVPEMI